MLFKCCHFTIADQVFKVGFRRLNHAVVSVFNGGKLFQSPCFSFRGGKIDLPKLNRYVEIKKRLVGMSLLATLVATLGIAGIASANLITNGDFSSGDLSGWESVFSSTVVTDFDNIPLAHKNNWNLNEWNSGLDGSFGLVERRDFLRTRTGPVLGSSSLAFSLDYAVAWAGEPRSRGYFSVDIRGALGGKEFSLSTKEIEWGTANKFDSDVFTGSLFLDDFIIHPILIFDEIIVDIAIVNPNKTLSQIVGIDNLNLSTATELTMVEPVPEPSTILLLVFGLIFLVGMKRFLA